MLGLPERVTACLFDLDGVLTPTAVIHNAAWTATFDEFLRGRDGQRPFDPVADYNDYVDGRPRADGVRDFLASRGITLPEGTPDDPPDAQTVNGLGNRKNELLLHAHRATGVEVYPGSVRYLKAATRGRAAPGGGHRPAPTPRGARRDRARRAPRGRVDGVTVRRARAARQAGPGHVPGRRPRQLGVAPDAGRRVRGRPRRGRGRPGRRVRLRGRRGPGRAAPTSCARTAPTRGRDRLSARADCRSGLTSADDRDARIPVEPWAVRETRLDLDVLAQTESVFALSNGHIGLRGNLDEGEPHGLPGTYLNSFYELRPLPYAEAGYGYPESGQTVVNVTNGKLIRLLVDDEPFDVRYGELHRHERVLDLRAGTLHAGRASGARRPGSAVRVRTHPAGVVHPAGDRGDRLRGRAASTARPRVIVQSELVANEDAARRRAATRGSPRRSDVAAVARGAARPRAPTRHAGAPHQGQRAAARPRRWTTRSTAPEHTRSSTEAYRGLGPDHRRLRAASPARRLRVVKFLAYGWSSQRSLPALRDQVGAAARRRPARRLGRAARRAAARTSTSSGTRADVEVEGDAEIQQAVRFALFHVLQAGARAEQRPIAAKGLTGPGYDGHAFWDTEMFVLPVLTYTQPGRGRATRCAGGTPRCDLARERAAHAGPGRARRSRGGRSAARSAPATGRPAPPRSTSTPTSPTAVDALRAGHRRRASSSARSALELLVETARLWRSLGHHDRHGGFHIDGVTGPDEYSAIADDNIYTNLMAQQNLLAAADAGRALPATRRTALGVDDEEAASWRDAAAADAHARTTSELRRARAVRRLHPAPGVGLRATPRRSTTRCCCTTRTSTCTASRWSSRPTWCWPCTGAGDAFTAEREGAQLRLLRARGPCATRRCRRAPRR